MTRAERYTQDVHSTQGRRGDWSEAELAILEANPHLTTQALMTMLPGRTATAVGNKRKWFSVAPVKCDGTPVNAEPPPLKAEGEYVETLSAYFVDYEDCLDIWLKWNGYITCRELCRDMKVGAFGIVTLLCQAK